MSEFYYEYEGDDKYCYPNSYTLKNKLNIHDNKQLLEAEHNITAIRILELKQQELKGELDFKYLCKIHKYIFQEQLRKENFLIALAVNDMPKRLAYYLSEINAIHPFREGNGRAQRAFIEVMAI